MTPTLLVADTPRLHVQLVPAFVTLLALGGQVGLPILVLTCLRFKRLNRHSTFVNCCVTSIIYSLVFCILLSRFLSPFTLSFATLTSDLIPSKPPFSMGYCGLCRIYTGQNRRAVPNHALCVAQASMIMAVLPMYICPNPHLFANKADASVGCPSLSSCLCSRYIQFTVMRQHSQAHVSLTYDRSGRHSKILVPPFSSHLRGVICSSLYVVLHGCVEHH